MQYWYYIPGSSTGYL